MGEPLPILQGRRFGCTRCGNCCMEPGYVFFTYGEMERMAAHLSLRVDDFRQQFDVRWDPHGECWSIDATDGHGCGLLDGARGCRVHPVKPTQCAAFPFWPELLDEARVWEETKRYCPGLDAEDGRLYSAEEIRSIRDKVPDV